jgi:hypothetical protein
MRKLMGLAGYFSWAKTAFPMGYVQNMNAPMTTSQKILLPLISLTMSASSLL